MGVKNKKLYYVFFRDVFFILLCCNLLQTLEYLTRGPYYDKKWLMMLDEIDFAILKFHFICWLVCLTLFLYLAYRKKDTSCFDYLFLIFLITVINTFFTPSVTAIP
jgi:hypothetical protein